ncbi:MAG TPA: fumarylacetoacetate hydrolase family protein [Streptosporangiaceae bacterium]|jgi:2-keto-4-pentenoate hydratase/2-oxohepta-3-ene-1,7-dioic acid hydratase in catechol pathway
MQLCSFLASETAGNGGGGRRPAVVSGAGVLIDLAAAEPPLPADLGALLSEERAGRLAALAENAPETARIQLDQVRLAAPVPTPSKIIGIGLNYRDHAAETGQELPARPTVFAKFPSALTGPYDPIVLPGQSNSVDYEGELGVVIGRRARNVGEDEALSYVGGYLAVNDVSARDVQNWTSQWSLGKSFDTFAPVGPFLVTAAEVPDPQNLEIETRLNGVTVQHSSTANMVFTVAALVSQLSAVMTLEPGDIIATGTPGGIGGAQNPPLFLKDGDIVEVEIERLGCLRNPVVAAPGPEGRSA